jgi:DNA-binding NarL/FixJ family response regulator
MDRDLEAARPRQGMPTGSSLAARSAAAGPRALAAEAAESAWPAESSRGAADSTMAPARALEPAHHIRVVIGDDEALMREGLRLLLERRGFEVVGEAADAEDLVRKARAHNPDIVVADIPMPPTHTDDGLRAAIEIRKTRPDVAVLVLSHHVQRRYARELLESAGEARGLGYLLKQRVADAQSFCADVRRICAGGLVLDQEVVSIMLARRRRDPVERLTPRQLEVLALMADGLSNAGIAQRLCLSEKAVIKHVINIYNELGLERRPDDQRRVLAVIRYLDR